MQTQCPHCDTIHTLAAGRKRRKSTMQCKACGKKFKVSEMARERPLGLLAEAKAEVIVKTETIKELSAGKHKSSMQEAEAAAIPSVLGIRHHDETIPPEPVIPFIEERMPWEQERRATGKFWLYGTLAGMLLFAFQLIYFEWDGWSQNRHCRPYLEMFCRQVGCRLPAYRNLAEFEVIQGGLTTNPDDTLSFKAVISNHALYPQRMPDIKLNLLDFNEMVFAERTFTPKEYGTEFKGTDYTVPAEDTFAVQLLLAKPVTPVGGYTLDLVD